MTDDMLQDAIDGLGSPEVRKHLAECPECTRRVDDSLAGLALAGSADVPEPPPLYWEVFRRQVGRRIDEEGPRRRAFAFWLLPALATATLVLVVFGLFRVPEPGGGRPTAAATLPAWSALPPAEEDEGLEVLEALAASGDALDVTLPSQGVAGTLTDLSDEESEVLAHALQDELGGGADTL